MKRKGDWLIGVKGENETGCYTFNIKIHPAFELSKEEKKNLRKNPPKITFLFSKKYHEKN